MRTLIISLVTEERARGREREREGKKISEDELWLVGQQMQIFVTFCPLVVVVVRVARSVFSLFK